MGSAQQIELFRQLLSTPVSKALKKPQVGDVKPDSQCNISLESLTPSTRVTVQMTVMCAAFDLWIILPHFTPSLCSVSLSVL